MTIKDIPHVIMVKHLSIASGLSKARAQTGRNLYSPLSGQKD
jgi:hypothetical protein